MIAQSRLDELLDGLSAGVLTAREQSELDALIVQDPEVAKQVARICALTSDLHDQVWSASHPVSTGTTSNRTRPRSDLRKTTRHLRLRASVLRTVKGLQPRLGLILAGIAALVAVLLLAHRPVGVERWIEGQAQDAGGARIAVGQPLVDGAQVVATDRAVLCYADGTRVRLADGSRLRLVGGPGKQLHLDQGRLQARVAKQPGGAPFLLRTAQVQVTVVGTQFTLTAGESRTELAVSEGAVRLLAQGAEELVTGGQQRVVVAQPAANAQTPASPAPLRTVSLIPRSAVWAYRDRGESPERGWLDAGFADQTWVRGPAPLGYDRDEQRRVFATTLHSEDPAQITTWFRHEFTCEDPVQVRRLLVQMQRDDGVVLYLNGREVVRDNLPAGEIGAQTFAVEKLTKKRQEEVVHWSLPVNALRPGRNCIAAEVHQQYLGSTDLLFALELLAELQPPAQAGP